LTDARDCCGPLRRGCLMKERLRVKPILLGCLVSVVGGMIAGIAITVYTTGGDMGKMQTFADDMSLTTHVGMACLGVFLALLAGYVTARLSPHDPSRHVRRLGLILVILGVIGLVVGVVQQGIGAPTAIGVVSIAATYGAAVLGGYLATDD